MHTEHAVTDGRDFTEARALLNDATVVQHTVERLAHEIQFTFGVPPQVQGRNVNSERMASSNRLNEQAITHFRTSVALLKEQLEEVLSELAGISFGRRADTHVVDQLGHLLKTDVLVNLYAHSYNINKDDFDRKRVALFQDLGPEKRQKTDEDKLKANLSRQPTDG